jgi:hypothetical protein
MRQRTAAIVVLLFGAALSAGARLTPAPAAGPLPFYHELYTFRGAHGATAVVAAFAVPAGRLGTEGTLREVRYRFDVTLVLADTALRTVARTDDSVFVRLRRPLGGDHLLYTQIELEAPPSRTTQQQAIMTDATTPGRGQLYVSHFPIPDYSGPELMLSDVALGYPETEGGWRRGEVTVALLPASQFPSSAFDVYYEIYNLPDGHDYTTEIAVERVADDGSGRVVRGSAARLRFHGEAAARDRRIQELRRVETSVAPGRYRITVTVTDDETGRSATRARVFQVLRGSPGATLVAALPRRAG